MAKNASRASEIPQATLARCRMPFAKEPNVNGLRKKALSALATFGWQGSGKMQTASLYLVGVILGAGFAVSITRGLLSMLPTTWGLVLLAVVAVAGAALGVALMKILAR